jgi:DNA replication protein DnaC
MLTNPTVDKLNAMRFLGMAKAYQEQNLQTDIDDLDFNARFALLVDREMLDRENRRLKTRLRKAKLRQTAAMEDIDYKQPRGLDKSLLLKLADCSWVKEHHNILIVGPTGTGKTYLACALAHKTCLQGFSSHYVRVPRLLPELNIARGDGSFSKRINEFAKIDVLVLDDWGLITLAAEHRRDLLEILDDRHGRKSTIVTSQLPVKLWHEIINDSTLADAILDRLIHNAYRLELKGESMRKIKSNLTYGGDK